jgi:hypothetical protein
MIDGIAFGTPSIGPAMLMSEWIWFSTHKWPPPPPPMHFDVVTQAKKYVIRGETHRVGGNHHLLSGSFVHCFNFVPKFSKVSITLFKQWEGESPIV